METEDKLKDIVRRYNTLIRLIKVCDCKQKLDMLKDLDYIEITINEKNIE
jgi:hypothetical protein